MGSERRPGEVAWQLNDEIKKWQITERVQPGQWLLYRVSNQPSSSGPIGVFHLGDNSPQATLAPGETRDMVFDGEVGDVEIRSMGQPAAGTYEFLGARL